MFNYASFCKILSISQVYINVMKQLSVPSQDSRNIVTHEVFKLLMSQVSLRRLEFFPSLITVQPFTSLPGAKDCLKNLSVLSCYSDIHPVGRKFNPSRLFPSFNDWKWFRAVTLRSEYFFNTQKDKRSPPEHWPRLLSGPSNIQQIKTHHGLFFSNFCSTVREWVRPSKSLH